MKEKKQKKIIRKYNQEKNILRDNIKKIIRKKHNKKTKKIYKWKKKTGKKM